MINKQVFANFELELFKKKQKLKIKIEITIVIFTLVISCIFTTKVTFDFANNVTCYS